MESSIDNPDYVPLSVKVVIVWFYLLSLFYFFGAISFVSGRFYLSPKDFIFACLALMSAWGLGAKRNTSRVIAIGLALWRLGEYLYVGWLGVKLWLETSRIAEIYFNLWGEEYPGVTAISFLLVTAGMYIFTVVILLQPRIRDLFSKNKSVPAQSDSDDVVAV